MTQERAKLINLICTELDNYSQDKRKLQKHYKDDNAGNSYLQKAYAEAILKLFPLPELTLIGEAEKPEITLKEGDIEVLMAILHTEKVLQNCETFPINSGWSWRHVRVWPATLSRFHKLGLLDLVYHTSSYNGYRVSDFGKAILSKPNVPEIKAQLDHNKRELNPDTLT